MAPPSIHDVDSELATGEHDACVSRREFRTFRAMLEETAENVKRMMEVMMISTPERGSMLDVQRKQDAEIALVRAELAVVKAAQAQPQTPPLSRRILDTAVLTAVAVTTTMILAFVGKGIVVSIVTEAMRLAGGAK